MINGEGKEYDKYSGNLLFSCKYLNGKRTGKGEEYKYISSNSLKTNYKQITIFSGEYLNGQRKEGKEYNYAGKLIYNAEYLNGKRSGKGKLYDKKYSYDRLKYEGEFFNGKRNSKGIEYEFETNCHNMK